MILETNLSELFKNQKLSLVRSISNDSDITIFKLVDRNIAEIPHLQVRQTSHNQVDTKKLILFNLIRGIEEEIGRLASIKKFLFEEMDGK